MGNQIETKEALPFVTGSVINTIFRNEAEHFSIVRIKITKTNLDYQDKEIIVKGYFDQLQDQTAYCFYGVMEKHPRYGSQLKVQSYETILPTTKDGLVQYLSSDLFYGVGKKSALKIVEKLGENAVSKIMDDPSVLDGVSGVSKETGKKLAERLRENQGFERVAVKLSEYGIGLKMAQVIYQIYRDEALEVLKKDPYQYVFDIEGFGFKMADQIASGQGISHTHESRIGAGVIYILQQSIQAGHVYLPFEKCMQEVIYLLHLPNPDQGSVSDVIMQLNTEKKVIVIDERVYLPSLYYAEDNFTASLKKILTKPIEDEVPLAELLKITGEIEEEESLSYGKEQFDAIVQAIHSKIMILTGGPGTGKTTVITGIIQAFAQIHELSLNLSDYQKKDNFPFILTAPTGRAAKRMSESTGLPAVTIHRLLGWNGMGSFEKDEHEPLSGKLLIVDEFSMVDTWLANHLFKAIPDTMQIILVGDEDQLPSVGPGQVLTDLMKSEVLPVISLTDVYRQKEGSKIIQLAHQIKNTDCDKNSLENARDFSFISCHDYQMTDVLTSIIDKAQKKGIDSSSIQVLSPMYRSQAGIHAINEALQQLINPPGEKKREIAFQDVVYRVGDRVIQLINQPEDGIYNGDIGEIVAMFKPEENAENEEQIVIAFEDKEVVFIRKDYNNFTHAFCISIHKSQGSEFPIVILPVVYSHHRMLRKNLLYTAITRGKESLIICGEKEAFIKGVQTEDTNRRYTSLQEMLHIQLANQKAEKKEYETVEDIPEEELSPYDFMD